LKSATRQLQDGFYAARKRLSLGSFGSARDMKEKERAAESSSFNDMDSIGHNSTPTIQEVSQEFTDEPTKDFGKLLDRNLSGEERRFGSSSKQSSDLSGREGKDFTDLFDRNLCGWDPHASSDSMFSDHEGPRLDPDEQRRFHRKLFGRKQDSFTSRQANQGDVGIRFVGERSHSTASDDSRSKNYEQGEADSMKTGPT
jgi:hypothetical protein